MMSEYVGILVLMALTIGAAVWFFVRSRSSGSKGQPPQPETFGTPAVLAPHEAAKLGLGTWGRQPGGPTDNLTSGVKGVAHIRARVYRAATDSWEEVQ